MSHAITHHEKTGRFEINKGGKTAYVQYNLQDRVIDYSYVYVPVEFRGQGIAAELAQHAMEYAIEHSLKVKATCLYIRAYIDKNPLYKQLLY